uniref:Probable protein S-acyltransferase 12 isoform X1 n=1 Tax=Nicotiana tabacum TaxID=4097 RepID=A0A1S4A3A4_TOBAC|nr:PREDICTED: probable protein S-acyltransferase 12 isoform X1 [Nicotiana tabacum]
MYAGLHIFDNNIGHAGAAAQFYKILSTSEESFILARQHYSRFSSLWFDLDAVLNLAFSLSLLCFVIMHASLLSSNTTSVEVYEKKKTVRWKYDLGWKRNFEQVFGANKALWFLPMFSKKDLENIPALYGVEFPTRSDTEE